MKKCKICKKETRNFDIDRYGMCRNCYEKMEVWKLEGRKPIDFSKIKTIRDEDVDNYEIYNNFEKLWDGVYIVKNVNQDTFCLVKHIPGEDVGQFFEDVTVQMMESIVRKMKALSRRH